MRYIKFIFVKTFEKLKSVLKYMLCNNRGEAIMPDDAIKILAKALLPNILDYINSDKGKAEYEKWCEEQNKLKNTSKNMEADKT